MTSGKFWLCLALGMVVALAAACDGGKPDAGAGATSAPAATAPADLAALLARADPRKGKIVFLQCRACHSLVAENEPGKIGPSLYGIIGRPAGTSPGFNYSEALAKSAIRWTPENLDKWLERPSTFLPDNRMIFIGVPDPRDRANVIAYIRQQTSGN